MNFYEDPTPTPFVTVGNTGSYQPQLQQPTKSQGGQAVNTKTAPDSCPFCGSAQKYHVVLGWYECETEFTQDGDRTNQTPACVAIERYRLTRERDEARARVQWFIDEWDAAQVVANFEPIPFDRSAVLVTIEDVKKREAANWEDRINRLEEFVDQLTNPKFTRDDLPKEALLQRIKRLEEAGDSMAEWLENPRNLGADACLSHAWREAKEAKL